MRNLLNRLKPEFKAKLPNPTKNYDKLLLESLTDDLSKNKYWFDLKFNTVIELVWRFNLPNCNPSTIDSLFDNE